MCLNLTLVSQINYCLCYLMDIYKNVIPKSSRSIILLTRFVIEDIMILETNIGGYLE